MANAMRAYHVYTHGIYGIRTFSYALNQDIAVNYLLTCYSSATIAEKCINKIVLRHYSGALESFYLEPIDIETV